MSGNLGKLSVDLLLNTADWVSGLTAAEHAAKSAADKIDKNFRKMGDEIMSSFKGIAAGLAAGFSVAQIVSFGNEVQKAADELGKMSQRTGASVEWLAEMSLVAELSGANIDDLGKGFNALNKKITEAAGDGGSKAAKVFEALNVKVRDASGALKSSEQIFKETAKAINELPEGAVKTAVSLELMGKQGANLIPTFAEMASQSAAVTKASKEHAAAMKALVAPATEFNDAITLASFQMKTAMAEGLAGIIKYINELRNAFSEASGGTNIFAEGLTWLLNVAKVLIIAFDLLGTTLVSIGKGLGGVAAALTLAAQGKFSQAWDALTNSGRDMVGVFGDAKKRIDELIVPTAAAAGATKNLTGNVEGVAKALADSKEKTKEAVDEFAKLANVLDSKEMGLNADFAKNVTLINEAFDQGRIGLARWEELMAALVKQQPLWINGEKARIAVAKEMNDAVEDAIKAEEALRQIIEKRIKGARELVESMEMEVAMSGMTEQAKKKYLLVSKLVAEANALEAEGATAAAEAVRGYAVRISEAIDKMHEIDEAKGLWDDITNVARSAFDSLFDSTEGGWKKMLTTMRDGFKRILMDFIWNTLAKKWSLNIVASLVPGGSTIGTAIGAAGGDASGPGSIGSIVSGISSIVEGGFSGIAESLGGWMGNLLGGSGASGVFGAISSALPWVGVAMAAFNLIKGMKKPSLPEAQLDFGSGAMEDNVTVDSIFGRLGFNDANTKYFSGEIGKQVLTMIDGLMRAVGSTITDPAVKERITAALAAHEFDKGKGTDLLEGDSLTSMLKEVFGVVFTELDSEWAEKIKNFDGSAEEFAKLIEQFVIFKGLMEGLSENWDINAAIDAAKPKSAMESYQAFNQEFLKMISNTDSSNESLGALLGGMQKFQQATVAMVMAIDEAAAAMHNMFMDTAESIKMSMMDEEERYAYLQSRADENFSALLAETDPEKIKQLAESINADINAAWGMLSEEERQALGQEYLDKLARVDKAVGEQMDKVRTDVIDTAQTTMETMADKLDELFKRADATADKNQDAAETMQEAAANLNVTVTVHGGDASITTDN